MKSYIIVDKSFIDLKIYEKFPQFNIYSIFYNKYSRSYTSILSHKHKAIYDIKYTKYILIHFIFYNVLKFYTKEAKSIYNKQGNIKNIDFILDGDYTDSYTHYKLFTSSKYITALYYKMNYSKYEKLDNILKYLKNNDIHYIAPTNFKFKYSINYDYCAYYEIYEYKNLYEWDDLIDSNVLINNFIEKCNMNNFIENVYDNINEHPYLEI